MAVGYDPATLYAIVLNIVLLVINLVLAKHGMDAKRAVGSAEAKLQAVSVLVRDFLEAYSDKVITREEAEKLLKDVERIINDP